MPDRRKARGQLLAQEGRVKHCSGPLWFVESATAGGYLFNTETGQCQCPDQTVRCKHAWAVEFAKAAGPGNGAISPEAPKAPEGGRAQRGDFTAQEQAHLRAALKFFALRSEGWTALAKALRFKSNSLQHVAYGRAPSAKLALRLARFALIPLDQLLAGLYAPAGVCPRCGFCLETQTPADPTPKR